MPLSGSYFYPSISNPISSYPSFVFRNRNDQPGTLPVHGQLYVLSPSNDLYFKDSDGVQHQITPPAVAAGVINYVAGEALGFRDAIFIASDGKVYKTSTLSTSSSFAIGFTLSSSLAEETIQVDEEQGKILDGFSGLITGLRYYLSGSQGKISQFIPLDKDTVVYQIGVARSSTELLFYPRPIIIL